MRHDQYAAKEGANYHRGLELEALQICSFLHQRQVCCLGRRHAGQCAKHSLEMNLFGCVDAQANLEQEIAYGTPKRKTCNGNE